MKRGPKPLGDEPMSGAERKRRSREKLKEQGTVEFGIKLDREMAEKLDQIAKALGLSRTATIELSINMVLGMTDLSVPYRDES